MHIVWSNVRFNANIIEMRWKAATPDEIASVIAFLASEDARFINGRSCRSAVDSICRMGDRTFLSSLLNQDAKRSLVSSGFQSMRAG
jgi:hypothetical protein